MPNENFEVDQLKTALGLYVENPWERVKFIFMKNDHGEHHPDLIQALQAAEIGFIGGVGFGGLFHQNWYLQELKARSDTTLYHSKGDAGKQLARESLSGFLKGAFKWGPRTAAFTGGFALFASCVQAYRNKYGVIEYSVGGTLVGGLLKLNFGIKGMLVGSLVGMILGTAYGVLNVGVCKLTKTDGIHIKYGQYALSKYMNELGEKNKKQVENSTLIISQSSENNLNPLSDWEDDKEPKNNKEEKNLK